MSELIGAPVEMAIVQALLAFTNGDLGRSFRCDGLKQGMRALLRCLAGCGHVATHDQHLTVRFIEKRNGLQWLI